MQALVLVGGEGTRLRPLTLTEPKPALPLVDRPFIRYMVDWLAQHGIDEVIMACGFRAEELRAALGDEVPGGPRILYIEEPEPLGTAGPIRLADEQGLLGERFVVCNGDVLTDLDLTALQSLHERRGAVATLALYAVADPTHYGLVKRAGGPAGPGATPPDSGGEVLGFLEKPDPTAIDTDEISAGSYVLERAVLELIAPGRAVSIEREVFPRLVGQGLFGRRLEGYWMDIGTPERYLQASWDILEGTVATELPGDGGPWIAPGVEVAASAEVARRAVLRAGSCVADRAVIDRSVVFDDCTIGRGAEVRGAILGREVEVGEGARIEPGALVGRGARIDPGAEIGEDARVAPLAAIET